MLTVNRVQLNNNYTLNFKGGEKTSNKVDHILIASIGDPNNMVLPGIYEELIENETKNNKINKNDKAEAVVRLIKKNYDGALDRLFGPSTSEAAKNVDQRISKMFEGGIEPPQPKENKLNFMA